MNRTLVNIAIAAITNTAFTSKPSECQKYLRQCLEACYGPSKPYDAFCGPSAKASGTLWQKAGKAVAPEHLDSYPEPGDILYKMTGSGDDGHVVIFVGPRPGFDGNDWVAENSVVHSGVNGAKGFRRLPDVGNIDLVVRLPDPNAPKLFRVVDGAGKELHHGLPTGADGTGLVRVVATAAGGTVAVDDSSKTITIKPK